MSRKDMKPRILRHDWGSGKKFLACFENRRGRLHVSLVRSIPSREEVDCSGAHIGSKLGGWISVP